MRADRATLHKRDLPDFEIYAISHGYESRPLVGAYEVLRIKKQSVTHVFYIRDKTHSGSETVHVSVPARALSLVHQFISHKRSSRG